MAKLSPAATVLKGISLVRGIAFGPIVRLDTQQLKGARAIESPSAEKAALERAIAQAIAELASLIERCEDEQARSILEFQVAFLEDETLTQPIFESIQRGQPAETAWQQGINREIADYQASEDPYFRDRADDLKDIRDRVLCKLFGCELPKPPLEGIVVCKQMLPAQFISHSWGEGGLVVQHASPTSHLTLLARARGVPVVAGIEVDAIGEAASAVLDGYEGLLILDPDPSTQAYYEEKRGHDRREAEQAKPLLLKPAVTRDGEPVRVMVNLSHQTELHWIDRRSIDGVGLVRTELLFGALGRVPSEEEQAKAYGEILCWSREKPVTIRLLDVGGDKSLGHASAESSTSFLGVRGVRLLLRHPTVLRTQLRALARVRHMGKLRVMVPMVTLPEEMRQCRKYWEEAISEVKVDGEDTEMPPLGMMVEVPLAALSIEAFDADFFSIGSNDLLQYLAAASRDEPELNHLLVPSPAALNVIARVVSAANSLNKPVSLCGDLGSEPSYVPLLLDCGLREFSVAPDAIGRVKQSIASYGRKK